MHDRRLINTKSIFVVYYPDSISPSDRHWLSVAWSADFANIEPTVACQPQLRLDTSIFCRRWANTGPTVDFYARWGRAIIGDFVKLSKKLFIMVCLKIILTNYLTILDIKIIFSL